MGYKKLLLNMRCIPENKTKKKIIYYSAKINFLESINLLDQNGKKYVLIIINYFSKMVFIKTFQTANIKIIINFWSNHLMPIFKYSIIIYMNNSNHFANYKINIFFTFYNIKVIYISIIYS